MSLAPLQLKRKQFTERLRGWILSILYFNRPDPAEWTLLSNSLDQVNSGVSRHVLAIELSFLVSHKLVRVFPIGASNDLTDNEQQQLLQRCAPDQEGALTVCAWIRTESINFA